MNKKFFVVLCVLINAIYMNAKAENFDYKEELKNRSLEKILPIFGMWQDFQGLWEDIC